MKTPTDCNSLDEVRAAIDRVDEQIIALLGLRGDYVRAAARFKTSEQEVAAPERQAAMLEARRQWAVREGLDGGVIEKMYRDLIAHFIEREREHWRSPR